MNYIEELVNVRRLTGSITITQSDNQGDLLTSYVGTQHTNTDLIIFFNANYKTAYDGDISIISILRKLNDLNNTLYAGKMTFDAQTQIFTAETLRPLFFGYNDDGDYALQADTITADNKNGIYKAQGKVQGWIVPAEDISKYTQGNKDGTKIF